jgi:hypothetical protein
MKPGVFGRDALLRVRFAILASHDIRDQPKINHAGRSLARVLAHAGLIPGVRVAHARQQRCDRATARRERLAEREPGRAVRPGPLNEPHAKTPR